MNRNHKGTEFSNISRVWEQNEKEELQPTTHERGNEFGNVSETWEQNEQQAVREQSENRDEDDAA